MSKIPFTLDAWLKYKSQKVETRNGRPAHYIGLNRAGWQVFEVFRKNGTSEYRTYHDSYLYSGPGESTFDLFIVTPEPELSEFEKVVSEFAKEVMGYTFQGVAGLRNCARQLMIAAREQLIQDGYVVEKKAFHDAVKKVDPEVMKEVSESVDAMNEALRFEYEKGRAEALKDLPRWKEYTTAGMQKRELSLTLYSGVYEVSDLFIGRGLYIPISDLEKLPGFKED